MASVTREGEGHLPGTASSTSRDHEVHQHDDGSETSGVNDNSRTSASRSTLQVLGAVQGPQSLTTKKRSARSPGRVGLPSRGGEEAVRGPKMELAPPRRSRSRDRRMSMSILDSVFRRRRRPSLVPGVHESSDSEASADFPANAIGDPASTAGPDTWRSETCRQLDEETATTSSTVEQDEVDRQPRELGRSWQKKVRRRINDISPFSKTNNQGILSVFVNLLCSRWIYSAHGGDEHPENIEYTHKCCTPIRG